MFRIARISKVMRTVPALLTIIKGIGAASRATIWSAVLLITVTYTFSILFTNQYHQGKVPDDEVEEGTAEELFGSMGKSFFSLIVMGTILDDVTLCTDVIRASPSGMEFLCAFLVYIVINSFTIMNLLVGVLVEMVDKSTQGEQKKDSEDALHEAVKDAFQSMDKDHNGELTRDEFSQLGQNKKCMRSLRDLGVELKHVQMYSDLIFGPEDSEEESKPGDEVTFDLLVNRLLRYRPTEGATSLDLTSLSATVRGCDESVFHRLEQVEISCASITKRLQRITQPRQPRKHRPRGGRFVEEASEKPRRISTDMLSQLELIPDAHVINELQRRYGLLNIEEVGIPIHLLDDELQHKVSEHTGLMMLENGGTERPKEILLT